MSNSPFVSFTQLSPNNSGQRTHAIDRITPHHAVGLLSVENLGACFASTARQASSNYGIGSDGRVGMYVPENCRSWCSSSAENDQRAVTIECADEATYPYKFPDAVYDKLIDLCIDVCERNGKRKLLWLGDRDRTLAYQPREDEMILTIHKWFTATSCPGSWLIEHLPDLAQKVTERLAEPTPDDPNVYLPVLSYGRKDGYVRSMQTLLIAQKFSCGGYGADGSFGPATKLAVQNFQRVRGLPVTGVCDDETWEALIHY